MISAIPPMRPAAQPLNSFALSDLLSIQDLSPSDVREIFDLARMIKSRPAMFQGALAGKQFVLMFEKPSLRTRITFEVGITKLGGHAMFMEYGAGGIEGREKLADVAHNLERWVDGVILRTFKHSTVTGMAQHASIPVINALTELEHPCQALADYFTLQEKFGDVTGIKLAFVGDGNNVAHSLMLTAAALGSNFALATPVGYGPDKNVVKAAQKMAAKTGARIEISNDCKAAVAGADAIYTDVWASMGQESEAADRDKLFREFQVNRGLMKLASPRALFLHCLPAHRGDEVTDEVLDSAQSVVFDEAENRLHVQNAILVLLASQGTRHPGRMKTAHA
ncbi:MAG TPA: ornithine carbamoyltransferase [Terriglobales bacterium]|nr:ornithine carbamoyltransferase [Terriglobales bacterium]